MMKWFFRNILLKSNQISNRKTFIQKQMTTEQKPYRNKPLVIIYGCTGTGKTKLSIELAKQFPNGAEIINADAMQLYKGLDVITNKATVNEMCGIKHHMIGFLDPLYRDYIVQDYRKNAIEIIDNLLQNDKLPILVGGTNYYVESILWDILIEDPAENESNTNNKRKDIVEDEFYKENLEKITDLFSSSLANEDVYKQLQLVDPQSAQKVHPNDRRKLCRALEIYYQHGKTKTELIVEKNSQSGSTCFHGPLRYTNACIFLLNCDSDVLNKRLDDRVDQMIANGMLNELEEFCKKTSIALKGESLDEYSKNYQIGIFQSIGFKEFNGYFEQTDEAKKKKLFDEGVVEMKANTRRYARKQLRWILNRFVKRSNEYTPNVYELDTTDLEKWNENVHEKASDILKSFIEKTPSKYKPLDKQCDDQVLFEYNKCETCNKVFININQWNEHMNGKSHKRQLRNKSERKTEKRKKIKEAVANIVTNTVDNTV